MTVQKNTLTAAQFLMLYESAGWKPPCLEQIEIALGNSVVVFGVFDGGDAIAMARLLGDGAMSWMIKDLVVKPEHQGKGIGRLLLEAIEAYILEQIEDGWAVCIELMSAKGKEGFYRRHGFGEYPDQWHGMGMGKMLRKRNGNE